MTANLVEIVLSDHKLLDGVCVLVWTLFNINLILNRLTLQVLRHPIVLGRIDRLLLGDWSN